MEITKEKAIELYGSRVRLAEALGISKAAISQWADGEPIPEAQALKIRFILKPEAFDENAIGKA